MNAADVTVMGTEHGNASLPAAKYAQPRSAAGGGAVPSGRFPPGRAPASLRESSRQPLPVLPLYITPELSEPIHV